MPPGEWSLRTPDPEIADRYRAEGLWTDHTLGQLLADGLATRPDRALRIWSDQRPYRGTFGDGLGRAQQFAGALQARGVGADDVIAFQLPNHVEAVVTFWGLSLLGAPIVPIVHFYGPKEVEYILRQSGARVLVTADRFGHLDYLEMLEGLRPRLPDLEHVIVVGDDHGPWDGFEAVVDRAEPVYGPHPVDPDAPALIAYTSGTTADPKGVIHTHRTIGAEIRQLGAMQPAGPPLLTGAPVGHAIGMLAGLLLPVYRGESVHLIDVWDPTRVLEAVATGEVYAGSGATFFLLSLLDHPDFGEEHRSRMTQIGLGGSPVPAAVGDRAESLGISIVRSYGSTEHPSTTGATHDEPNDKRKHTDGHPLVGVELRLVDDDGTEVAPGEAGEILSRGPDLFAGYTDPALTAEAVDADGWYHTGDVGVLDEDGWLTITDRKKDIIIRGGENVSAAEVEEQLVRLPGVAEVAVVAAPDERLGEHACAFIRAQPGTDALRLEDVRACLEEAGLARQKWPEEVRAVDDFPRTASGKIKKYELRARLRGQGS